MAANEPFPSTLQCHKYILQRDVYFLLAPEKDHALFF